MPSRRARWLRDRRRVASGLVVALVVGTIVALSLTYRGVATADVDLNDGGVWVSNESSVLVGRLNHPVREIDATLAAETADIDLLQRADDLLLLDRSAGLLRRIDTVNVQFSGSSVAIPADAQVGLGDGAVAVLDPADGRLWVTHPTGLSVVEDATVEPTATLGEGVHMAMGDDGTVHLVDVVDNEIVRYTPEAWQAAANAPSEQAGGDDGSAEEDADDGEPSDAATTDETPEPESTEVPPEVTVLPDDVDLTTSQIQITAVGDEAVVLAHEPQDGTLTLHRPDHDPVDLSGLGADIGSARLQASAADGDVVAVATTDALVLVPLQGGEPRVVPTQQPGPPAQPVQVRGCVHSAWAGDVPSYLRVCGDAEAEEQQVPQAAVGAELVFRVNRDLVVLNDLRSGDVWMLEDRLFLVENWEDVISSDAEDEETEDPSEQETDEVPLDREAENRDPVAEPDDLAGRPGRTVVLPVLVNDKDPDGDLLTVASFQQPPESFGVVEPILGGRALQIRLAADASGQTVIEYAVTDGRGGEDTASITIAVHGEGQNAAPEQLKPIEATVVAGEAVEVNILNDVRDPDGDPVYLVSGQADDTLRVSVRPDGLVTVEDLGVTTGRKQVVVQVTDGRGGEAVPITLDVEVLPDSAVPPQAVFDFATGFVGEDVVVEPLVNDVDPNGKPLQLAIVTPTNGGDVRTDTDAGTFTFRAGTAGSYYLTYVVTDDDGLSAEGLVRVDVGAPDADAAPVAVSDTALLPPGGSVAVDAIANDTDPGGGVLAVQSIDVPDGYGLQVAILDHRVLRITSERTLTSPVTIGYTVSNGTRSADGEVDVVPLNGQAETLPPVANPDSASVRVGDHVTVPVLRNDTHPNGLEIHVSGIEPAEGTPGLAFVSQDLVRYAAPDEPGTHRITYTITDTNGQSHSAVLTVYVEARGDEVNAPPQPADIEVRAFAGERIRIPVDIYGIDPDGDSVQLVGPLTSPERGRIVDVQSGYIDYVAYNTAEGGTDSFELAVRDRLGAIGTATVTIGVIPPPSTNRSPVAAADLVHVRPDRQIQVDVLINDTDPDGDQLGFGDPAVVDDGGLEVAVEDGMLTFTSPSEEGEYTVLYKADDGHGGQDVGSLTVRVDADAPFVPPVAVDDLVPAIELLDATTVDVDVLDNDYDPDGSNDDLVVSLPVESDVELLDDGRLRIPVAPTRQVVTYQVTDPDGESTYAFVEVPGTEDTGPVLTTDAELEVNSNEELVIDLTEHVVSLTGRPIRLFDNDGVTATNSDGGPYVVDATTLRFVSAPDYAGPASITFEVTDFADINAADVISSVLTIPIRVIATDDQPPTFRNGSMELEAGGDPVSLDIRRLADDPDTQVSDLELSLGEVPDGFSATLENGAILTASADLDTPRGTTVDLPVLVSDGVNDPVEGVVTLTATGSSAPLLVANDDDLGEVPQGQPVTVDVLSNDTNPFDGEPRTVVDAFVETGSGSASVSGDQVVVTPGADYVGRFVVVYTVEDATGEPERRQDARITATVLGAPDTPARPAIGSVGDSEVVVDITPPNDNGSPITGYEVTASGGPTVTCATTTCRVGGLTNDVTYTFTVVATNAVGSSDPSAPSAEARPDVAPGPVAAPSVQFGDQELSLTWREPVNNGSDIVAYDVQISPMPPGGTTQVRLDGNVTSYVWQGLVNGDSYRFRVRAVNDAPDPGAWGDWSRAEYPSGPPAQPAAPTMVRIDNPAGGQVEASWTAPDANGDSIDVYHVTLYRNGSAYRTVDVPGGTLRRLFDVENGYDYSVSVVAENRSGPSDASPRSSEVRSFGAPGQPPRPSLVANNDTGSGTLRVTYSAPNDNGQAIQRYEYRLSTGGSGTLGGSPATISGLSNGQSYTVQVRACNTYCGAWSASSNAASPYAAPAQPPASGSISSSANGRTVAFSWNYPASSNGAAITGAQIRVDNGSAQNANRTGQTSVSGDWEQNHTFQLRVQNEHGQWSPWSNVRNQRAEPDPTPPVVPTAWITQGPDRGCQSSGSSSGCRTFILNWKDWPGGSYQAWVSVTGGQCGGFSERGPYRVQMSGSGSTQLGNPGYTPPHYGHNCGGTTHIRISPKPGGAVLEERAW